MATTFDLSEAYEQEHVHEVYEQIAVHFSSTRYKPWPIVERFLQDLPDGAVGLDVGCGNGKYLSVNPNVFIIASDRSPSLVQIASQRQKHNVSRKSNIKTTTSNDDVIVDVAVADGLALPHPAQRFDFAISIAVVHHLSTKERRIGAIREILNLLKSEDGMLDINGFNKYPDAEDSTSNTDDGKVFGGIALFYVWAVEQKNSRRGWDEGHEQDVMVPWIMKRKIADGEAKEDQGKINEMSQTKVAERRKEESKVERNETAASSAKVTFQRYYHLYCKGELEANIEAAGGQVVRSGYEKDNWWALAKAGPKA